MNNHARQNQACLLEVIACTVEDAIEAERGGADRLEVISRFDVGGLTPSPGLVREIKAKVSIPLRVMLRENEGYGVAGKMEIENLCAAAREFNKIGVDGVVLGFLRDETEIDLELTGKILACAPDLKATFHHAFEDAADKFSAIEKLKNLLQIDRILAHGGQGMWVEKIFRLGEYATAAQPEIERLCAAAHEFNQFGVDGVVLGFLRDAAEIDLELTGKILACAPDLKATFHHAFEDAADKFSAIERLKNLPQIDRVLAHGGRDIWAEKILRLGEYATAAQPEIEILVGGGVDLQIISMIREKTSVTEFHVGRAARIDGKVESRQVALLAGALTENYD